MWRPARVPLHQPRHSSLAQQEPAPTPPPERASWETEAAVGFGAGALTGVILAAIDGKKLFGREMVAGGGAGFIVANVLRLI